MHEIQEPFHHVNDLLFLKSSAWRKKGSCVEHYSPIVLNFSTANTEADLYPSPDDLEHSIMCKMWLDVYGGNLNKEESFGYIGDFHFNIFFIFWKRRNRKNLLKMCGVCGCLHEFNRVVISLSCRSKFNIQCEMKWWKCYPIN